MELLDHFKIFSSLIFGSIAITGCFDKSTDVIDDPKVSISESKEASHNSDDANKVTSDQKKDMGMVATSSTNNDNSIQADNGFIKVASKDPGQAAFDEFMNSSFATELPTTKPDSKALSQTSMDEEKK